MQAQVGRRPKSTILGHSLNREIRRLQKFSRTPDPRIEEPLQRGGARLLGEPSDEGPLGKPGVSSQRTQGKRLIKSRQGPFPSATERVSAHRRDGCGNELRLPAVTVWSGDQGTGDLASDHGSEVAADDVQAQVDATGHSG